MDFNFEFPGLCRNVDKCFANGIVWVSRSVNSLSTTINRVPMIAQIVHTSQFSQNRFSQKPSWLSLGIWLHSKTEHIRANDTKDEDPVFWISRRKSHLFAKVVRIRLYFSGSFWRFGRVSLKVFLPPADSHKTVNKRWNKL